MNDYKNHLKRPETNYTYCGLVANASRVSLVNITSNCDCADCLEVYNNDKKCSLIRESDYVHINKSIKEHGQFIHDALYDVKGIFKTDDHVSLMMLVLSQHGNELLSKYCKDNNLSYTIYPTKYGIKDLVYIQIVIEKLA